MKTNPLPYKNYLFDLYGTLVDIHTQEDDPRLWEYLSCWLAMDGIPIPPRKLQSAYEKGVRQLEASARKARGSWAEIDILPVFCKFYTDQGHTPTQEEVLRLARLFRMLSLKKLKLFPGAEALLQKLQKEGCGVYLLSNAQRAFTAPELRMLGLERYFHGILLSSDAGIKKPDPAFYRMLLDHCRLDPKETVMVGNDDIADCHGAAAAGLDSFYLYTEQSPLPTKPLPGNCRRLKNIAQLLELL